VTDQPTTTISAVITGIGMQTPVTNAEWGRIFADALLELGDEDAIRHALADAGESYRSRYLSASRSKARSAVSRAIKQQGANGTSDVAMQHQLAFEICFEGFPPQPLIDVTHEILVEAEAFAMRQHLGMERNLAFIRQAVHATAPFPGQCIRFLIESGALSAEDFVVEREETA